MNSEKSQILATNSIEKDQISVAANRRHAHRWSDAAFSSQVRMVEARRNSRL
jgi:hypothetical protein